MNDYPDYSAYHKSLTDELYSIKNRVRNLVKHSLTDGEAKETALRSMLKKLLPVSVTVGRGFIVGPDNSSTQIDVLILDSRKPTLFKDGDLFIVTPDAVLGVIEVKTRLSSLAEFSSALTKLSRVEKLCRHVTGKDKVWTGLFSFDAGSSPSLLHRNALNGLREAHVETGGAVNCISCGKNIFTRYWDRIVQVDGYVEEVWHSYYIQNVAPSYFMGNLIDWITNIDNSTSGFAWFPLIGGKEKTCKYYLSIADPVVREY